MPPAFEFRRTQENEATIAKHVFDSMNGNVPKLVLGSDATTAIKESGCLDPKRPPTLIDQHSTQLSVLSLIDEWPQQKGSEFLAEGFDLEASHEKGLGEKRDGDRNIKRSTNGHGLVFHHRQGSGDLYTKLQHFDDEEDPFDHDYSRRISYKTTSTSGAPGRYVVKGYGSWGEFDDILFSPTLKDDGKSSSPVKHRVAKHPISESSECGEFPLNNLDGIPPPPRTTKGGGVLGLKEWYKNRTLVSKATNKDEAPPKPKYLQKLVLSSWKHNGYGARGIFNMLSKRPLQSSPVIALKGLITIHKLLQQGSPSCRIACYQKKSVLSEVANAFRSQLGSAATEAYNRVVSSYGSVLVEKVSFHNMFPNYESNYSIDLSELAIRKACGGKTSQDPHEGNALTCLQNLLDMAILALGEGFALLKHKQGEVNLTNEEKVVGATISATSTSEKTSGSVKSGISDPVELIVAMLILMLREADLLYEICWFLLSSRSSLQQQNQYEPQNWNVKHQVDKFKVQHQMLRTNFELAKSETTITSKVTPPNLPLNPQSGFQTISTNKETRLGILLHENVLKKESVETRFDLDLQKSASPDDFEDKKVEQPKPIPLERQNCLGAKGLEDSQVEDMDDSWVDLVIGKAVTKQSQDKNVPIVGGVGAAAAAALQRFAAGQTEARRLVAPSIGLKNIRLEPPPCNFGFNNESRAFSRPARPQHTRGIGRRWSSFDDEAFLHQKVDGKPWSPIPRLTSPKFYSPRALGPSKDMGNMLSSCNLTSSSPLLIGLVVSSYDNKPVSPLPKSPMPTIGVGYNPGLFPTLLPTQNPQIQPRIDKDHLRELSQYPNYPLMTTNVGQLQIEIPQIPPMIELDSPSEIPSTVKNIEEQPRNENQPAWVSPMSWRLEGSMSNAMAWNENACNAPLEDKRMCCMVEHPKDVPLALDWEIPSSELKVGAKIGQGAFGDVLKGTWQGTEVAIKRLQNNFGANYSQAIEEIRHEVAVIMRLRHPNIILFMGACTIPPEICIVMEFASNGSLFGVLHNPNIAIDMTTIVRWATEAARGMNYLHTRKSWQPLVIIIGAAKCFINKDVFVHMKSPPVVHRDLKSINLLVDGDWHIKVSDFGLAMTKQSSYAYTQVGTWGWMAPEVLESAPYNEKADVYSFGIVLWELLTREEPFKGYHPMQIMRAIDRGERPPIPLHCPSPYKKLVIDCWHTNPKHRPEFLEILGRLGEISSNVKTFDYTI